MESIMEGFKENQLQLVVSSSTASIQDMLDSQKELFHIQIDRLNDIVAKQCKLTGVNPLSQEMAAGALSIKIGKRPRDLLNPKAVKYMQSIFSIKDAISKKESREISARFGVTVTQVREFFTNQRSRVRKFVRVSREKAVRSNPCKEPQDGFPLISSSDTPIDPVPLDSVGPTNAEEEPSCSTKNEGLAGVDGSDNNFVQNIYSLMRKEETFSGQVKLMQWILQIQNASVLYWFLTEGGVMILATWLGQALVEEQTTVLRVILKVLCHLPLQKALPGHMSAVLQSVNRLRFYRASDISNRARVLLSRWSKMFGRSQDSKKKNVIKSSNDEQDEMLLKQSIQEIMWDEKLESKADTLEETIPPLCENSENFRKVESLQPPKLLTSSADDSNKKLGRGVSSSQGRERRKVLLVEHPGQKTGGRGPLVARSVPTTQGRPLSADDIQKAKMRAQFMQSKYGKMGTSDNGAQSKAEAPNKCSTSQLGISLLASKVKVQPKMDEQSKPPIVPLRVHNQEETSVDNKMELEPEEPLWKKCKKVQIPWRTPLEMNISVDWSVGTGENSKEVEIQKNRLRREKETTYRTFIDIPLDPKEPWDQEMDYDDTLTPQIPTQQLPDPADTPETMPPAAAAANSVPNCSQNVPEPEPDLELLAVLLKNPELVFALTSGQSAGGLSGEETVKLLDMIKSNGMMTMMGGGGGGGGSLGGRVEEKVEVSLPSPTPPTRDTVTNGRLPESAKNPFSRHNVTQEKVFSGSLIAPATTSTTTFMVPQQPQVAAAQSQLFLQPKNQSQQTVNNNFSEPKFSTVGLPSDRAETSGRIEPSTLSNWGNGPTRFPPHHFIQTPPHPVLPGPQFSESWRATRQGLAPNHVYQDDQNEHYPFQGPNRGGGREEFRGGPGYDSWSPDNSPNRYGTGWNYHEPGLNSGRGYGPEGLRFRNPSGYWDHGRSGDGRRRDRRR